MSDFSVRSMKKVLAGETDKRISKDSALELREEMEDKASDIAERAKELAENNDRVTVRQSDVRKASRELLGGSNE